MRIKRYRGQWPAVVRILHDQGAIQGYPVQIERVDLLFDEGIDIVFKLKGMTPAKFARLSDTLLLAAYTEAERYSEEKYRFAKFEVQLNRNTKGRKTINPTRTYVAAKHPDSSIMVYGEEALGYTLPEEYTKRPFLINKVEEILNIPDSPSPGPYVSKQRPYRVLTMVVAIRTGLSERLSRGV